MNDSLVRICSIKLEGFKNVGHGFIEMPSALSKDIFSTKSDILGIYGQNGSGKTAVIEAMGFVQELITGNSLPKETVHYVSKESKTCFITITFAVVTNGEQSKVEYGVSIKLKENEEFEITQESLIAAKWNGEKFDRKRTLLNFDSKDERSAFTPAFRYDQLVGYSSKNEINLGIAKKMAQRENKSYIFNQESMGIFMDATEEITADYIHIIDALYVYAYLNLFVISNTHTGSISMNFLIPFAFRMEMTESVAKGNLPIRLDAPSLIDKREFSMVRKIVTEMNIVLNTLIPNLSIDVHDFGEQLMQDGSLGHKIQLISKRGDVVIPLKYESEGIIKIVSILNALICTFNNPSMCMVIDELDSGVFEFLLGELLLVFDKGARGQLIFTSHNLRALEMLKKSSIVFATTNPQKRYIRLQNVKTNNNLRDLYLRSIILGGQKEEVYAETDAVEIGRAFRRAGKVVPCDEKN